jgi:hypothetical protein
LESLTWDRSLGYVVTPRLAAAFAEPEAKAVEAEVTAGLVKRVSN